MNCEKRGNGHDRCAYALRCRLELGIQHLNTAVKLDPGLAEARVRLGIALAPRGQLQDGEQHLSAAVKLNPDSAVIYNNLGLVIAEQSRFSEAIALYKKSL